MSGSLDHAPQHIIKQLLVDNGLGATGGSSSTWPIYATKLPDTPDPAIGVRDTAGTVQGRVHGGTVLEHYGVQVRIRADTFSDGWAKANAIALNLDQVSRQSVSVGDYSGTGTTSYLVHSFTRTTQVIHVGLEPETKREMFTLNGTVSITQN